MKKKSIIYEASARDELKKGIDALANAVKVTLGASGRNVIIEIQNGESIITKDGVTVAKHINLNDKVANIGAMTIKGVAAKTALEAGDGTTTATVLAQAIYNNSLSYLNEGKNPMEIKRGINKAVGCVVEQLKKMSRPVKDIEDVRRVATISANNDTEIGNVIASAVEKVGFNGKIVVDTNTFDESTNVYTVDGYEFNNGFMTPYFINNHNKLNCEYDNAYILLYDDTIHNIKDIEKVLLLAISENKPLIIVCGDMDGEALSTVIANHTNQNVNLRCCVVQAPSVSSKRLDYLNDIALLTGAVVVSDKNGNKLSDAVENKYLGVCEHIIITDKTTSIVNNDAEKKKLVKQRVEELEQAIKNSKDASINEHLMDRINKLAMSFAVIYVGGKTPMEISEKKDRYDDSVCATKSAIEEGVVIGGGVALLRCLDSVYNASYSKDESIGAEIIRVSIQEPIRTMLLNGGCDADKIIQDIIKEKDMNKGFNVKDNIMCDMFLKGIIDPTKVTRCALENSASIASLLITTECVVYNS